MAPGRGGSGLASSRDPRYAAAPRVPVSPAEVLVLNLEILVGWPEGSTLVEDYLRGLPEALEFYPGAFNDPDAYAARGAALDARFDRAARERAVQGMRAPTERGRASLERFVAEGGWVVTTGQQPGLLTGPLYSLYKGLTAIQLARALEERSSRPVVPLFWVASEDHDWAEVDHTWVIDRENELRRLRLAPVDPAAEGRPIHARPLGADVDEVLDELVELLPDTDFSGRYGDLARTAYPGGSTLATGFRAIMEALLGPLGLTFADAADPWVKEASRELLLRELDQAEAHEAALAGRAAALERAGYPVQVPVLPGGVNLFVEGPAGRERLYRSGDGFRLRHSELELGRSELSRRIRDEPGGVSPNVLLRPVVESALFPVLSYVGGPGELAYYAQLAPLYEAHGLGMPVVHPRVSVTLVEPKIRKVLDKFGLDPGDLSQPHHELAARIARDEVPADVRKALGELRGTLARGTGALLAATRAVDPTLKGPVTNARNTALAALDEVEKKIVQSVKRENEIGLAQIRKAQVHLFPEGAPQERMLNPFYYLFRFGGAFVDALEKRFADRLGPGAGKGGGAGVVDGASSREPPPGPEAARSEA